MQLMGQKALPLEDLAAMALEDPIGAEVVRAGLRVLLAALGDQVTSAPSAENIAEAAADVAEQAGTVAAKVHRALANDGVVDPVEARDVLPGIQLARASMAKLEASVVKAALTAAPALRAVPR
jgi:hypothetical protein